jgi:hypothetical protein
MYARLVRFSLGSGTRAIAEKMAGEVVSLIKMQPGCQGAYAFSDEAGECGIFVLWESDTAANAAAAIVRPKLDAIIGPHVQGPPDARLFEVLAS